METKRVVFEMGLWARIKAASSLWWAIVVTGKIDCLDDEPPESAQ